MTHERKHQHAHDHGPDCACGCHELEHGHDHDNDYVAFKDGIALGYGRYSGGLAAYHTLCRGCRVIELTEGSTVFDTWTRMETSRMLYHITVPYSFTSDDPQYKPKP